MTGHTALAAWAGGRRRCDSSRHAIGAPSRGGAAGAGSVLDVGAGGGTAGLAVAARTTTLTAFDSSEEALAGLLRRADSGGHAGR